MRCLTVWLCVHRCYSSYLHPTDAPNSENGFHDRCDSYGETLVLSMQSHNPDRVFGGFAGGSWGGEGWDSNAHDSFLMQLSPTSFRWQSSGSTNFLSRGSTKWPDFGELNLGDTGAPGESGSGCASGSTYGTSSTQPCGFFGPDGWGVTHLEVFYRCGEGSSNGPCSSSSPSVCYSAPCQNGGDCNVASSDNAEYTCTCMPGFTGG
eukprot:COSAG01_NODE_22666_length_846_cov_1.082999_2_plen_205_part_01